MTNAPCGGLTRDTLDRKILKGMWWMFDLHPPRNTLQPDNPFGLTWKQRARVARHNGKRRGKSSGCGNSRQGLLDFIAQEYANGERFTVQDIDLTHAKNIVVSRRRLGQMLSHDKKKRFEIVARPYQHQPSIWVVKQA